MAFHSYALVNFPDGTKEVLMTYERPEVGKPLFAENFSDGWVITDVKIRDEEIDGKAVRWDTWVERAAALAPE
jgi:hypothetical protein